MNRRHFERSIVGPIEIVIEKIEWSGGWYDNVEVIIEEVSTDGIRFSANVNFIPDELIYFHLPSLGIEALVSGRVIWGKRLDTGRYQYGLQVL